MPPLLGGHLLLADPSLRDGCFDKSVVLLVEHGPANGAVGMILNQPSGRVVGDFLDEPEFEPLKKLAVHVGGPVALSQLTFCSFWWSAKSGFRCQARISREAAAQQSRRPGRIVRAFLGYSGWSPGQLEKEMKRNAWITAVPDERLLGLAHDKALWGEILSGLSPFHRILSLAPDDPLLN